jgi:thiol-disulfide isomerase/thioredoxin
MSRQVALFILFICFFCAKPFAQGHRIEVKIKGIRDTVCYLSYYYENQRVRIDTAKADATGKVVFQGKKELPLGLYSIIIGKSRIFDIIIAEQQFGVETNYQDPTAQILIFGSRDNQLFYALQQQTRRQNDSLRIQAKRRFAELNKNTIVGKLIKASLDVETPKNITKPTDVNRFFTQRFLDNIDFNEDALVRSPFVHEPLKYYFEQLNFLPNDSLIKVTDSVLKRSKNSKDMRKYVIAKLANHFETSPVMGHDEIYVYILEKYYAGEPIHWDTATVRLVKERLNTMKPLLIGKTIPEIALTDTLGVVKKISTIKKPFTVVCIYATDCSHCQLFMPELVEYTNKHKNVGVYAINLASDVTAWHKFVRTFEMKPFVNVMDKTNKLDPTGTYDVKFTPTIYILDESKRIIGKGTLGIDNIERILKRYGVE